MCSQSDTAPRHYSHGLIATVRAAHCDASSTARAFVPVDSSLVGRGMSAHGRPHVPDTAYAPTPVVLNTTLTARAGGHRTYAGSCR
jgi:hypothetical protein